MPMFFFKLRAGRLSINEPEGVELPDISAAQEEARRVAHDLMQNCEPKTRHWQLDTCDAAGNVLSTLLFVDIDPTIIHLNRRDHALVRRASELCAQLGEAMAACHATILRSRTITARTNGRPYLAAQDGRRVA